MASLKFTVDSALLRELGEKLVETVQLALVELVKNSYDADATKVEIIFTNDKSGKSIIKIIDNGIGMGYDAVEKYWMRIATSNKVIRDTSPIYGRPVSGAKGIGRFCCRRLGSTLTLITVGTIQGKKVGTLNQVQKTVVKFPWTKFRPGTDVTKISCEGTQSIEHNVPTGTTLIIDDTDTSEEWSQRGYDWLKRQLAVLAANTGTKRPGFKEDPGFIIKLSAPNFEGEIRDIRNDLINAGWGTLKAFINTKGRAVCELDALGIGKKVIVSKGKFVNLHNVSLHVAIFVDDREQMRNTKILNLGSIQKILPEWGGVQVRYKGIRVYPYGDDDWLDINRDRGLRTASPTGELHEFAKTLKGIEPARSLLNMLSMRNYIGNVEISKESSGFEMKLNREGFIDSAAVRDLKKFVRFAIDWANLWREFYIRKEIQYKALKARKEFEELINQKLEPASVIESAVKYLEEQANVVLRVLPREERETIQDSFLKATEAIRKINESNLAELSHLRLIASTSTLLLIFSHEVKSLLGLLERSKNSLLTIADKMQGKVKKEVVVMSNSFIDLKDRMEDLLQMTSIVGSNQKDNKPGHVALLEKVEKVEKVFELIIKKYHINFDYKGIPSNIIFRKVLEAEIYSILLNVVSNSIKSVIAGGKNRHIKIIATRINNANRLIIKDTGIPLNASKYDEVFMPFIADPEGKLYKNLEAHLNPADEMIIGTGSGLGLAIVREIVSAREGRVNFIQPKLNWSNELQIVLP